MIIKSNSSGTIQWVRRLGVSSPGYTSNYPIGIVVDPDDESYFYVLLQGLFTENSSWGTNKVGYVLVKYNSSGSMQWQRVILGQAADGSGSMTSRRDNNVGHGSGKLGSFYIQDRGIVFSFSVFSAMPDFACFFALRSASFFSLLACFSIALAPLVLL